MPTTARLLIIPFLLAVVGIDAQEPPLKLTARYRMGFAPADFPIKIRIEPHADNRKACWEYDGPEWSRSCWDVRPKDKPTKELWLKQLPAGEYTLTVTLWRLEATPYRRASATLKVLPQGAEPPEFGEGVGCGVGGCSPVLGQPMEPN